MLEDFIARASEVGARVGVAANARAAASMVAEVFGSAGARTVILSPDLGESRDLIAGELARAGARLVVGASPEEVAGADVGVSRASLAVAETGSLLVEGNDVLPRLVTMLPLIHVALVGRRSLLASLDEVGDHLRRASLGLEGEAVRYASLVSGPSRTADVEKTLSTGVHGPRQLHIIIVSDQ
jgi:L-lactate dehydrogenase complex protein LldG